MRAGRQGFTLLELLLVVAIIAVLGGAFVWWLTGSIRRAEVREAAYQLVGELRQARSRAQKVGFSQSVIVTDKTGAYHLRTAEGPPTPRTLEKGVRIMALSGGTSVVYQAPYGTTDGSGNVWEVQSPAFPDVPSLYVKVVGITGKVMVSGSRD